MKHRIATLCRIMWPILFGSAVVLFVVPAARALTGAQIRQLKAAGVGEGVIAAMVREKTVETAAFRVEEIVRMKQAGLSDALLERIVTEGSFMKNAGVTVYGRGARLIRLSTVDDLLALKKAGFDDETIRAIITANAKTADARDRRAAWAMLRRMGILIKKKAK